MKKYNSEILKNEFINYIKFTTSLETFEDKFDFIINEYISQFRNHFNNVYSQSGENVVGVYCTYDANKNLLSIELLILDDDMDKTKVNTNYSFSYGELDDKNNGIQFEEESILIQKEYTLINFSPINSYYDISEIQSAILSSELDRIKKRNSITF